MNELEEIVQSMMDSGASEQDITDVIEEYDRQEAAKAIKTPVTTGETPEVPKGEKAEVSGDSVSPLAAEESSSESKGLNYQAGRPQVSEEDKAGVEAYIDEMNKPTVIGGDVAMKVLYPEIANEKEELDAIIASRPVMADNTVEQKRLDEISAITESLSGPQKSMRAIYKESNVKIESRMAEEEAKAETLANGSPDAYEYILESSGTYTDLKSERDKNLDLQVPYDRVLQEIRKDTNSDQHGFLGKIGKAVGLNTGTTADEILNLNDKVEEQILANLDGDSRTTGKIIAGNATLAEKEAFITNAKVQVIKNEKQALLAEAATARKNITDDTERESKFEELEERFNAVLGEVGFDQASGMLANNFKKTTSSAEFNEMVSQDGFFAETGDGVSTFLETIVQLGFKGTVGFGADIMSGISDIGTDQDQYSVFDSFSDTVGAIGNYNYLPSSQAAGTRLTDEEGNLNLTYKSVSKSLFKTLPFTLAIINDIKRGKITNIEASLGRLLNPVKSQKVTNSLKLIDSAYRHTLSDNIVMAEGLGLGDNEARVFANTLSMAEGMAELIMPDTQFFKSVVGTGLLQNFKGSLKKATTKAAMGNAVKTFMKNLALELGEEEVVAATEDLLKFSMVVGHENSEFLDLRNQMELAAGTVIMYGALGGANLKRDFKGNLMEGYKEISKEINGVSENLQAELDSGSHSAEVQEEIKGAMDWANKMNSAVKSSPESVTSEQIDLLVEKQDLITEMKSVDDAFHPQYKEQIEVINNKINPIVDESKGEKVAETTESTKGSTGDGTSKNDTPTAGIKNEAEQGDVKAEVQEEVETAAAEATAEATAEEAVEETEATVEETVEATSAKLAKAVRSAKVFKTPSDALKNLSSNPVGILAFAWDGALETVATSIELGGKLDVAVRKGLKVFKQSEYYTGLSKEGKKKAAAIFEKDVTAGLTPLANATVKKSSQKVKTTIRKSTGQVDLSEKVTTTKARLLKDNFKALVKGSKEGAKGIMVAKSSFVKEIKEAIKEAVGVKDLTQQEANRILSAVDKMTDKNYKKIQPMVDKVIEAMESRGLKRNIKKVKASVKKGSKSTKNPVNVRVVAEKATQISERYLDNENKKRYQNALNTVAAALKPSSNKSYTMVHEARILNTLRDLAALAEDGRAKVLAESMGIETPNLTVSEINEIFGADNVDEAIAKLKDDKKKEARTTLEKQAEYSAMALNDVEVADLTLKERRALKELKNADLKSLSATQVRDYIKIVDNIGQNGNFSSSGNIVSEIRMNRAATQAAIVFKRENLGVIQESMFTDLKSVALIFKKVFLSSTAAAKFNVQSGLNALSMAYNKHKTEMKILATKYDEHFDAVSKKKGSNVKGAEATMFRGLVAQLIQGNTKEDFDINQSRIEDHLSKIKNNDTYNLRLAADKLEKEYDKMKDLKSQEEVKEYAKGLQDGNWELVEFWLEHFDSVKDDLKENTEVTHGIGFQEVVGNYLPTKIKKDVKEVLDKDEDISAFFSNSLSDSKASTTTIARNKSKKLPSGSILDLDFDSVMFGKASAVSVDINTSEAYKDVFNFFNSKKVNELFGRETNKVFLKKITEMRRVQLGLADMANGDDSITKVVSRVERLWKSVATTIALGGVTQYPKQYISVVTNIVPNLGKYGHLMFEAMFTDKSNMPIFDLVSVSQRGDTQAGTVTAATRISEAEKRSTKSLVQTISQSAGLASEKVRSALFFSLRKGDVNVAKSSWMAFYKKRLRELGVEYADIDMETEHERLEDPRRQEAISYAEIKVEETQISSDDSRGSEFYQSKSAYKSVLRSMILPFQSFNINAKMRMLTDLSIISPSNKRATTQEKTEAGLSLLGTTLEVATFHSMKYYVLAPLLGLGKDAIIDLFGLASPDEDEDKKEAQSDFRFKQWYSALAKDLNPLSIGAFAEDLSIETLNFLQYLEDGERKEEYIDYISRKNKEGDGQMFYRYKSKEERGKGFSASLLGTGGLYGIPTSQYAEMSEAYRLMSSGTKRDDYGNLNEYKFTSNEKTFMKVSFALEMLGTLGMGEADTRRIFRKIKRDLVNDAPKIKIN